jgi:hypothetical protein
MPQALCRDVDGEQRISKSEVVVSYVDSSGEYEDVSFRRYD